MNSFLMKDEENCIIFEKFWSTFSKKYQYRIILLLIIKDLQSIIKNYFLNGYHMILQICCFIIKA